MMMTTMMMMSMMMIMMVDDDDDDDDDDDNDDDDDDNYYLVGAAGNDVYDVILLEAELVLAVGAIVVEALAVLRVEAVAELYGDWAALPPLCSLYADLWWRRRRQGETWTRDLRNIKGLRGKGCFSVFNVCTASQGISAEGNLMSLL